MYMYIQIFSDFYLPPLKICGGFEIFEKAKRQS